MSNLRQLGIALIAYSGENRGSLPGPACGTTPSRIDWVHWEPPGPRGRDIAESRILPFLGKDLRVLVCPSGPPEPAATADRHPFHDPGRYPFSYSVSTAIAGSGNLGPGGFGGGGCKLPLVLDASNKVMAVEEDTLNINDGAWFGDNADQLATETVGISVRHDKGDVGDYRADGLKYAYRGRGNVVFVDGHCEYIERWKLIFQGTRYVDPRRRAG
jgi:prepilin-type processing-associated H-X9-DG protein